MVANLRPLDICLAINSYISKHLIVTIESKFYYLRTKRLYER